MLKTFHGIINLNDAFIIKINFEPMVEGFFKFN